jgi:hypothetical protein
MAPKRKAEEKNNHDAPPTAKRLKTSHDKKDEKAATKDTDDNKGAKQSETDGSGSESGSEYEPSGTETETDGESDAATSASSSDDDDATSSDSNDDDSGHDSNSDDSGDDISNESKGSNSNNVVGRSVGGKTLRMPKEPSETGLVLTDFASEIFVLNPKAACVKGQLFLADDRILLNGSPFEIQKFETMNTTGTLTVTGCWLVTNIKRVRHGNYARVDPPTTVRLRSDTTFAHFPTAGCKITHRLTAATHLSVSDYKSAIELDDNTSSLQSVVGDKGKTRPRFWPSDRRWNEGEQRRLLVFLRRIWPLCERPPSVTFPMLPAPQRDQLLLQPDENEENVRDIDQYTVKYRALWDIVRQNRNQNLANTQRWIANSLDTYRRQYIQVQQVDWENAFRLFWAAADTI